MQAFREFPSTTLPEQSVSLPLAMDLTIGLTTCGLLALLAASQAAAEGLIQLGQTSEELFRGDRLPTLPLMGSD
ncbi:MAG: hypothetical protein WBB01_15850 [Phormidesmis sp.]